MKHIAILALLCACGSPRKPAIVSENSHSTKPSAAALSSSTQKSLDQLYFLLNVAGKRDSFVVKKHEAEVLYYRTHNEKFRVRCNKLVDSVNKYIHVIDSLSKEICKP